MTNFDLTGISFHQVKITGFEFPEGIRDLSWEVRTASRSYYEASYPAATGARRNGISVDTPTSMIDQVYVTDASPKGRLQTALSALMREANPRRSLRSPARKVLMSPGVTACGLCVNFSRKDEQRTLSCGNGRVTRDRMPKS